MALHCSGQPQPPSPLYLTPDPILSDLTENLGPFQSLYAMKPMFNPSVQGASHSLLGARAGWRGLCPNRQPQSVGKQQTSHCCHHSSWQGPGSLP